jgi:hypothetical protein
MLVALKQQEIGRSAEAADAAAPVCNEVQLYQVN